ncbi:MAG: SAM-dependent methyltransferase [Bacteroidetes bacterium]|nr:SAM-dependent methyltransferase [Bacteroidota bacterium]
MKGTLYLIPSLLGDSAVDRVITPFSREIVGSLSCFIVEDIKTARRFIKKVIPSFPVEKARFSILNEHTHIHEIDHLLQPLEEGHDVGLLSDAGCPAIADPGAELVALAHDRGIRVKPMVGPASILLALMASGFNGQNFSFNGYLPKERKERIKKLRELESAAIKKKQTQVFIETPYRNQNLFEDILNVCQPSTRLCIAADLTQEGEMVHSAPVADWKKRIINLKNREVVFLLYST